MKNRLLAALLCLSATVAHAAGVKFLRIPADAAGPELRAMVWTPCADATQSLTVGPYTLKGRRDCPTAGDKLPLVVISHGHGGSFLGHHDLAETLADAGYVVAAINHPGDTFSDMSRAADLQEFVERPADIKRLIDFMTGPSPFAAHLDRDRIGFFGFSRGGYTGLVLLGANPDWAGAASDHCQHVPRPFCQQILDKRTPAQPLTHDPRIKAAVLADPLAIFFSAESLAPIKTPVQLWASSRGGDGVLPSHVAFVDANLPAQHDYRVVPNSGHFAFFLCPPAMLQAGSELCADAPGFDRAAFHAEFNAEVLAFFRTWLVRTAE